MNTEMRMQQPLICGNRRIIPVVRAQSFCYEHGMIASVQPVALMVEEGGKWGITLLEGDSVADFLENLVVSYMA